MYNACFYLELRFAMELERILLLNIACWMQCIPKTVKPLEKSLVNHLEPLGSNLENLNL
jgi:hypothetical protein